MFVLSLDLGLPILRRVEHIQHIDGVLIDSVNGKVSVTAGSSANLNITKVGASINWLSL